MINNKKSLKTIRKELRNNLTPAEAKLWTYLQSKKLDGRKFRRQHSVDNYILDFYCPAEKLAVELDGEVHNIQVQAEHDVVFENPDYLLNRIREEFGKQPPRPSRTPPYQEGNS